MAASGARNKTDFILSALFNKPIRVVSTNMYHHDYTTELVDLQRQFRAIGNNYNQAVRALKTAFGEKKALTFLYHLEQETINLVQTNREIITLTKKLLEEDTVTHELKIE